MTQFKSSLPLYNPTMTIYDNHKSYLFDNLASGTIVMPEVVTATMYAELMSYSLANKILPCYLDSNISRMRPARQYFESAENGIACTQIACFLGIMHGLQMTHERYQRLGIFFTNPHEPQYMCHMMAALEVGAEKPIEVVEFLPARNGLPHSVRSMPFYSTVSEHKDKRLYTRGENGARIENVLSKIYWIQRGDEASAEDAVNRSVQAFSDCWEEFCVGL